MSVYARQTFRQSDQTENIHIALNQTTLLQTHHNLGWKTACNITTMDSVGKHGVPLLAVPIIH